jgi:hypothetical protein
MRAARRRYNAAVPAHLKTQHEAVHARSGVAVAVKIQLACIPAGAAVPCCSDRHVGAGRFTHRKNSPADCGQYSCGELSSHSGMLQTRVPCHELPRVTSRVMSSLSAGRGKRARTY